MAAETQLKALPNPEFWRGRRVLVTGNLGFKGSWLSFWLVKMGAKVTGFDNDTQPSRALASQSKVAFENCVSGDITDRAAISRCFDEARPEIVFHLAAQALVRLSYREPARTFLENVQGTVNVLEAVRASTVEACVFATSDKVYRNDGRIRAYNEDDPLGGADPYSASKAACDIAIQSYISSYFHNSPPSHPARICIVRSGNVIGGGDRAADRLLPDAVRAFTANEKLIIRSPRATRPWQHVLEPLVGYMLLAEAAHARAAMHTAWNFGPSSEDSICVSELLDLFISNWKNCPGYEARQDLEGLHEAGELTLDSARSRRHLSWQPRWNVKTAVEHTASWYQKAAAGIPASELIDQDIESYIR